MQSLFKRYRFLRRDENGVATIEFALWTTMFFLVVSVAMDFGAFFIDRGKMNEAVNSAAVSVFSTPDDVPWESLPTYVRGLTNEPSMKVTFSCNGVECKPDESVRPCACLKHDGTYVAQACGNSCAGSDYTSGSTAGFYLTITASKPFKPLIVPNGVLSNKQISQQATVRLQ